MKTILVVEDEAMNRSLVKAILESNGFTALEAANGKLGYEVAAANHPDMILMDIRMPVADGFESLKMLRADPATRAIPVIALTAYAMREDRERIVAAGFDGYLAKPFDLDKLLELVFRLVKD